MKPKTLEQLKQMDDIEIVDYALPMHEQQLNSDGSPESEYVFGRMADMLNVPETYREWVDKKVIQ